MGKVPICGARGTGNKLVEADISTLKVMGSGYYFAFDYSLDFMGNGDVYALDVAAEQPAGPQRRNILLKLLLVKGNNETRAVGNFLYFTTNTDQYFPAETQDITKVCGVGIRAGCLEVSPNVTLWVGEDGSAYNVTHAYLEKIK